METITRMVTMPTITVERMESYLRYLKHIKNDMNREFISNAHISSDLRVDIKDVKNDLECIHTANGITEIHDVSFLIRNIQKIMGSFCNTRNSWAYTLPGDDKFDC
ncbi:MAG: hypothetical protein JEZ03_16300 [Bacteroidales bacterium]|nr:hypothetical protein [Bacteroidales bacterium]